MTETKIFLINMILAQLIKDEVISQTVGNEVRKKILMDFNSSELDDNTKAA